MKIWKDEKTLIYKQIWKIKNYIVIKNIYRNFSIQILYNKKFVLFCRQFISYCRMCYSKRNRIQRPLHHFFLSRSRYSLWRKGRFGYLYHLLADAQLHTYTRRNNRSLTLSNSLSLYTRLVRANQISSHSINNTDRAIPGLLIASKWTHRGSSCFFFFGSIGCSVFSSREKTGVATRPRVNHFTIRSISRIHSVRELGNFMDECFADVRDKNIRSDPADINAETLRMPRDLEAKI